MKNKMIVWKKASWSDGNTTLTGKWCYIYESDMFHISLDNGKTFKTMSDHPEWHNFKLIKNDNNPL